MRHVLLLALIVLPQLAPAQTNAPDAPAPKTAAAKPSKSAQSAAQLQAALDQLTQTNRDLLDLLKKQQSVLEDMQYDRRLQSRQIESLGARLADAMQENRDLQRKVATLEAEASVRPVGAVAPTPTPPPVATTVAPATNVAPVEPAVPAPPASYLPPAPPEVLGLKSWHRLFALKGEDAKKTDLFAIQGRVWRVVWHNQDKPGKNFANTSGLFVNAFPKDDTIPQRVCGKVGSGGDTAQLQGPGNYYLQIDASGGSWELAVEDYH